MSIKDIFSLEVKNLSITETIQGGLEITNDPNVNVINEPNVNIINQPNVNVSNDINANIINQPSVNVSNDINSNIINQPNVNIVNDINSNIINEPTVNLGNISQDKGDYNNETIRVVLSDNQQFGDSFNSIPISINRSCYPLTIHKSCYSYQDVQSITNLYAINSGNQIIGSITNGLRDCPLNSVPLEYTIQSTSNDDINGGIGLRSVNVYYYASQFDTVVSIANVNLNGTTPQPIGAIGQLIWRIVNIIPTPNSSSVGSEGVNVGAITVNYTDGVTSTQSIGEITSRTLKWNSSHIYIPPFNNTSNNFTRVYRNNIFDYVNVIADTVSGAAEELRVYTQNNLAQGIWIMNQTYRLGIVDQFSLNLNNSRFTSQIGYDVVFCLNRPSGAGVNYISLGIGLHQE